MKFIANRSLEQFSAAHLVEFSNGVYMLESLYNSPFMYKKGAIIWLKKEDYFSVYEIDKDICSARQLEEEISALQSQ